MIIIQKIRRALYWFFNISINTTKRDFVKGGGVLGRNCVIYADVEFGSEPYLIHIGDNCRITNGVRFVTHDGGLWTLRNQGKISSHYGKFGPINVKNNVHIGWNAIIMPGVTIGNNCVIGCGAVVTHDIPGNSIAAGVPARVIKSLDEYLNSIQKDENCFEVTDSGKREQLESKYRIFFDSKE